MIVCVFISMCVCVCTGRYIICRYLPIYLLLLFRFPSAAPGERRARVRISQRRKFSCTNHTQILHIAFVHCTRCQDFSSLPLHWPRFIRRTFRDSDVYVRTTVNKTINGGAKKLTCGSRAMSLRRFACTTIRGHGNILLRSYENGREYVVVKTIHRHSVIMLKEYFLIRPILLYSLKRLRLL